MNEMSEQEWTAAEALGEHLHQTEPRATSALYDRTSGRVTLNLANQSAFVFPARSLQGLGHATDDELEAIEILGEGYGIRWETLDADFTVPGLLMGLFGTRAWMDREHARRAGSVTTPAKAAAARANGKRGGRPRRAVAAE